MHTLDIFLNTKLFEELLLVCHEQWAEEVRKEIAEYSGHRIKIVTGGKTRQESSYLGLLACGNQTEYVVIHDAVRPFVSQEIIAQNVQAAVCNSAVDTCIPSADTIVHSKEGFWISDIPLRSQYLRGQTPQSFAYLLILEAHKRALELGLVNVSDDCKLVAEMGHKMSIVLGSEQNMKITTELDLFVAEQLFRLQQISCPTHELPRSLQGMRIAITGGTGSLGQALATLLEREGAIPLLISKSASEYRTDLTSHDNAVEIFEKIYSEHGPLDALINSIGLFKLKEVSALSSSEIEELVAVNLTSCIFCCKAARIKKGGQIINIASSAYSRGRKEYAIYSCAKAAVVNFTQALAEERSDLKINAVAPQRISTPMRRRYFPEEDPDTLLSPEKVAEEIATLLKYGKTTGSIVEIRKT